MPRTPILAAMTLALTSFAAAAPNLAMGEWRAWLDSPGGELPFGLEIVAPITDDKPFGITAFLVNGAEKIEVPVAKWEGDELVLSMDYYDAHLRAKVSADGRRLDGQYTKRRATEWAKLPFHATFGAGARFTSSGPQTRDIRPVPAKRFLAKFADDPDAAVLALDGARDVTTGTFLTTTGDYRFLAGDWWGDSLRLSCFDGAHAFLFTAKVQPDGSLKGDFWSGATGHDTWTAIKDDNAALPDAFAQVKITEGANLNTLAYPDLEGKTRSLSEPGLGAGAKARVCYVFGSWCPNCKDCTAYLDELLDKYGSKGLAITGLAFEVTGDKERDAKQARTYTERAHVRFPVLLAGVSDKAKASPVLPILERIKAYPTIIFADRTGTVRSVYTGFSGPATGEENTKLRRQWEKLIEGLLSE